MRALFTPILLSLIFVLTGFSAHAQGAERTISVTGDGAITLAPDMAVIVIGMQFENPDAGFALDETSRATQAVLDRLNAKGIDPAYVRSGAIQLQPRYSSSVLNSGQQIVGYRAINTVQVDVHALDQLGGLISDLIEDGANRLDRVSFGLQDPSSALDAARHLAVLDAMARADLYAHSAGVDLGVMLRISEQGNTNYRRLDAEPSILAEISRSSPTLDVPIAPGEIELNASINMVFAIEP